MQLFWIPTSQGNITVSSKASPLKLFSLEESPIVSPSATQTMHPLDSLSHAKETMSHSENTHNCSPDSAILNPFSLEAFANWWNRRIPQFLQLVLSEIGSNQYMLAEDIVSRTYTNLLKNYLQQGNVFSLFERYNMLEKREDETISAERCQAKEQLQGYVAKSLRNSVIDYRRGSKPPLEAMSFSNQSIDSVGTLSPLEMLEMACQIPEVRDTLLENVEDEVFFLWYLQSITKISYTALESFCQTPEKTLRHQIQQFKTSPDRILSILIRWSHQKTIQMLEFQCELVADLPAKKERWAEYIGRFLQTKHGQPLLYRLLNRNKHGEAQAWKPTPYKPFRPKAGTWLWIFHYTNPFASWEKHEKHLQLPKELLKKMAEQAYPAILIEFLSYQKALDKKEKTDE